jgi:hypothetical protein
MIIIALVAILSIADMRLSMLLATVEMNVLHEKIFALCS